MICCEANLPRARLCVVHLFFVNLKKKNCNKNKKKVIAVHVRNWPFHTHYYFIKLSSILLLFVVVVVQMRQSSLVKNHCYIDVYFCILLLHILFHMLVNSIKL